MTRICRPASFSVMPFDGLLRLEPNSFAVFGIDRPPEPDFSETVEAFRRLRGDLLASVFPIVNELVLITLLREFGSLDGNGRPDFQKRQQQLRRQTFGVLIRSATAAIVEHLPSGKEDLMRRLAEMKRVRDALAHQPFWLEPINDPTAGTIPGSVKLRTLSFLPRIADDEYIWTVDDTQIHAWLTLSGELADTLSAVRQTVEAQTSVTLSTAEGRPDAIGIVMPAGGPFRYPTSRVVVMYNGEPTPELPVVPGEPLSPALTVTVKPIPYQLTQLGPSLDDLLEEGDLQG